MKITLFTSNQTRHLNFAIKLAAISDELFLVSESRTVFPGKVKDFFDKSLIMQQYFSKVIDSEKKFFGNINFLPKNIRTLPIKAGDLNFLSRDQLKECLSSDIFIVFGSSFIKGWLIDFLIQKGAFNLHMGLSPFYRGSACNFWALYDKKPSYIGATIHLLSKGLDSGDIIYHSVPTYKKTDSCFDFTMRAVVSAQESFIYRIKDKTLFKLKPCKQNSLDQIRYSKNSQFKDEIAKNFMENEDSFLPKYFEYPNLYNPLFL